MNAHPTCSTMPGKGWSILTVRTATAKRVKELAHERGIPVDEYINTLMKLAAHSGWTVCNVCGAKVKSVNLPDHIAKVHPGPT